MSRYLLAICVILFAACSQQGLTHDEKTSIAKDVQLMLENYFRDVEQLGLMAEFKYLDSSDEFFWVPPGYGVAINYDSVARAIKANAQRFRHTKSTFDSLRIIPLTNGLATYTARISSVITDTAGAAVKVAMVETGTVIRRGQGWKLLSGQTAVVK